MSELNEVNVGGLLPHVDDERDFEFAKLGGLFGGYEPKHRKKVIQTLSVKNQERFNTCVFNALTVQKELAEGVELSVKSAVCYAKNKGYLSGDGYSDLRSGQRVGVEFGIAEEKLLPDVKTPWPQYSDVGNLTEQVKQNAAVHKAKSYFIVKSKDDYLKAIDDGIPVHTGFDWFSSYNMGGGLKAPWILPWRSGLEVGGHAVTCIGYDLDAGLLIFQNSYGKEWGDGGKFYVRFADFFASTIVGFVSVDLDDATLGAFISQYNGKHVKSANSPVIYLIENGEKRPFPDEATFYAYGGKLNEDKTWVLVSDTLLNKVPTGNYMDIVSSPYWDALKDNWNVIKWLQFPNNFKEIERKIRWFGENNSPKSE